MKKIKKELVALPPKSQEGYGLVYILRAKSTNRYKIGRTTDFPTRLKFLEKQAPYPFELFFAFDCAYFIALEQYLHEVYADFRVHGEWFEIPDFNTENVFRYVQMFTRKTFALEKLWELGVKDSSIFRTAFDFFIVPLEEYYGKLGKDEYVSSVLNQAIHSLKELLDTNSSLDPTSLAIGLLSCPMLLATTKKLDGFWAIQKEVD